MEHWKAFDLDGKRSELDLSASKMTSSQDSAAASRKKLAENTREFKRQKDDAKLKTFPVLLRNYQEEIDALTRRAKGAETAFLALYKDLATLPDPCHLKVATKDESSEVTRLELQNKKLQRELEEFHKEFQEIQNQEVTIRRLDERLRAYDTNMQSIIDSKLAQKELQLEEKSSRVISALQEKEEIALRELAQAQKELKAVEIRFEDSQTELMNMKAAKAEEQNTRQAEFDMLSDENQRLLSKLATLESNVARSEATEIRERGGKSVADLELAVAQRDIEISQLRDQLHTANTELENERSTNQTEGRSLQETLHKLEAENKQIKDELRSRPTQHEVQSMKKKLDKLNLLQYNFDDLDSPKTAEDILKDRNRKLETENMQLKDTVHSANQEISSLREQHAKEVEINADQKALIAKLEEDLAAGSAVQSGTSGSDLGDLLKARPPPKGDMLQIVCSQRDRFKSNVHELEQRNLVLSKQITSLEQQLASVKNDNVTLYQKIKYLESYNNMAGRTSAGDRVVESKYKRQYEESVNPFVLFNRKERYEKYKSLSAPERITLRSGEFFLSHKYLRTFIFFYALLLHLLVMGTLYRLATATTCI